MINAAGVLYVTGDNDSILILRRTAEGDLAGTWALPGGKIEEDEGEIEAARREVEEETGRDASKDELVPWVRTEGNDVTYQTFLCRLKEPFEPVLNSEHDAHRWVPVNDLVAPQGYRAGSKKDSQEIVELSVRHPIFTMRSDGTLDFYGRA